MNKISHFNLPENTNRLYADEARSSIGLTREVANKINELVDAYNKLDEVDLAWKQEQVQTNTFPVKATNGFCLHMKTL